MWAIVLGRMLMMSVYRHRVTLKKRYGLLLTQKGALISWASSRVEEADIAIGKEQVLGVKRE